MCRKTICVVLVLILLAVGAGAVPMQAEAGSTDASDSTVNDTACQKTLDAMTPEAETAFWNWSGELGAAASTALDRALSLYENEGYDVSFCVLDLETGSAMTYNTEEVFYSASTIKAPYIVSCLYEDCPCTNDMYLAGHYSDNDAYLRLREAYGREPLETLLTKAGLETSLAEKNYPNLTSLDLLRMWYVMTPLLLEESERGDFARQTLEGSLFSAIADTVGTTCTVYSKAGWIDEEDIYVAYNAAGLVLRGDHPYLVSIMSDAEGKEEEAKVLASALELVHRQMIQN